MIKKLAIAALAGLLWATPARAQRVSANLTATTANEVRGMPISEHPMLNPSIGVSYNACSGGVFANYDTQTRSVAISGVSASCSTGALSGGLAQLRFGGGVLAREAYVTLTGSGKWAPYAFAARTLGGDNGLYGEVGASRKVGALEVDVAAAYNRHYYRSGRGFSHVELGAHKSFALRGLTVTPGAHYTLRADGSRDALGMVSVSAK